MPLSVAAIPCLSDNYAWLLTDAATGTVALCDPGDAAGPARAIEAAGGRLDLILLTHHHGDHVAGVPELVERFGARVVGAAADAHRLPKLDQSVRPGEAVAVGETRGTVIDTPGHTVGHIAFHFPEGDVLLCGDTLFSLGCGRLLEGTPAQMHASLQALAALPEATLVCCGHEYTESNARFALTVEPENAALRARAEEVRARFGAKVVGAAADAHRLPKLDLALKPGETVSVGATEGVVIDTPGHTVGHVAFHFAEGNVLLCGDTLFSLGCGRLLEGTAEQMFHSLKALAALPEATLVCCGHEYTESNARFALSVEPGNAALQARAAEVKALRAEGRPTVPTTIRQEKAENPFLRAGDVGRLATIRTAKDNFR